MKISVKELKAEIRSTSSSAKDEVRVMGAMLNDRDFKVDVYGKNGKEGEYCPAADARAMIASVINATTKISKEEAQSLADAHDFKKAEAQSMVNIAKEFVNTYTDTGRRLPLGGRETSNNSLIKKEVGETVRTYPKKVGVNPDGSAKYEKAQVTVKPHTTLKVSGSCPDWIK